jgi:hypothetical protein
MMAIERPGRRSFVLGLPTRSFSSGRPRHPTFGRYAPLRRGPGAAARSKVIKALLFLNRRGRLLWNLIERVTRSILTGTKPMRQSSNILR